MTGNLNSYLKLLGADERLSVSGLLFDLQETFDDCNSIVCIENGKTVCHTSHQLFTDVLAVCAVMSALPLCPSTVAIIGENSYNWLVVYLACSCCGIAVVTVDCKLNQSEISEQLNKTNVKFAFCDGKYTKGIENLPDDFYTVILDDYKSYTITDSIGSYISMGKSMLENGYKLDNCIDKRSSTITHIAFDSAAFGRTKAVALSSRNVYEQVVNASDALCMGYVEKYLVTEHFSNTRSVIVALSVIAMGLCVHILPNEGNSFAQLYEFEIDTVATTPYFLHRLYVELWKELNRCNMREEFTNKIKNGILASKIGIDTRSAAHKYLDTRLGFKLMNVMCFSNNLDPEIAYGFHRMGVSIRCAYEATECGIVTVMQKADGINNDLGKPLRDVVLKIGDGRRIMIRSNACMSGYIGDSYFPDYWLETKDYGDLTSKNCLVLCNDPTVTIMSEHSKRVKVSQLYDKIALRLKNAERYYIAADNGQITLYIQFKPDFAKFNSDLSSYACATLDRINRDLADYEKIIDFVIINH